MLPNSIWEELKHYKDTSGVLDWDTEIIRLGVRRFLSWRVLPLWHDIPNAPPPDNVDLSHRNTPYLPMVVVTIRSVEQVQPNDR